MNIKILTPESVIFEGDVDSVLLPGKNGDFHIKKDHADIVSSLINGNVQLFTTQIAENFAKFFTKENDAKSIFSFPIKSGVVEFHNNKGIILAE
ncbi:MAG: F0F1 ATP synthase subunit epsilon [Flavobacteriaceae bacterium]|jgi:F-type H+-transporting ATPase subunit epsilon|nr:F0F1 ATP synthase subunit epsilon [Flavobacteriaceae bacterium]